MTEEQLSNAIAEITDDWGVELGPTWRLTKRK